MWRDKRILHHKCGNDDDDDDDDDEDNDDEDHDDDDDDHDDDDDDDENENDEDDHHDDDDDDGDDERKMRMWMLRKMMMLIRTTDPKTRKHTLREPAQSKCTWTGYKSHFAWKFTRKLPTPIPRHTFCASLRSRNAHGHFTRAIWWGNLQGTGRTWTSIKHRAVTLTVRTPSVWPHCLGNNMFEKSKEAKLAGDRSVPTAADLSLSSLCSN